MGPGLSQRPAGAEGDLRKDFGLDLDCDSSTRVGATTGSVHSRSMLVGAIHLAKWRVRSDLRDSEP